MIRKSSVGLSVVALVLASGCACREKHEERAAPTPVARAEAPPPTTVAVAAVAQVAPAPVDPALEREYPPVTWWGEIVLKGEPGAFPETPLDEAASAHRAWIDALARDARASQGRRPERLASEPVLAADTETTTPAPAGCHMRRLDDARREILIYETPGVTPIARVGQGAPCEILGSVVHAGTRWYRVSVLGVLGWSPLVDAF
jgi:hypothetical protein